MGYDLNLLADGSVDDQFLCHICCGILQCPRVVVGCGHAFCQLCIDRWLEVKNRCPVYRCQQNELILGDIDDEFREKFCRIRLKCKNFGMGCIEIIEIDNLEMHESSCQFSKDHYYQCHCGQTVNKKDTKHNCIEYLKNQIESLKQSKTNLELIRRDLEKKLTAKDEECQRLSQMVVDCQLSKRRESLTKRADLLANRRQIAPELQDIVDILKELSILRSAEVERTVVSVDRRVFCPQNPYNNYKTDLGFGAEFNSPVTDCLILEALKSRLVVGARVLHIGCGTGYLTACMAVMCGHKCQIVAIDHVPQLIQLAETNIKAVLGSHSSCIKLVEGDGRDGCPDFGPYDLILVEASVDEVGQQLFEALETGGRLCAPVGDAYGVQDLRVIDRSADGSIQTLSVCEVSFSPLTDKDIQLKFHQKNED